MTQTPTQAQAKSSLFNGFCTTSNGNKDFIKLFQYVMLVSVIKWIGREETALSRWNTWSMYRGGRGRGGRRGGRGGGHSSRQSSSDETDKDYSRPRPPPHLKGKEIGLWHAARSRFNKEKKDLRVR